jgi:predicted ATP-dependent endonuclease of OLD family
MRLEAFKVENYKKIRDTGWVSCRELTVFVGKNESGKSAIFRGLSKLNPSDNERYDSLKEFPRRRFTDEFKSQDWPVTTCHFVLDDSEKEALSQLCPLLHDVKEIEATRHYSWKLEITFHPRAEIIELRCQELIDAVDAAVERVQGLTAPEDRGEALGTTKQSVLSALGQARNRLPASDSVLNKAQVDTIINAIAVNANQPWQKELLDPVAAPLRDLEQRTAAQEKLPAAKKWVEGHLPKFIYFDRFDVIDSAIHVPTFVQSIGRADPRARTTHCLFRHVGLDVQKLVGLGRHQPNQPEDAGMRRQVDERAILTSSASNAMTQKFEDWWEQRRHRFRYQLDGDYFRIWVSDDLDPSEIELDQRSAGMQYFFSFFTVFLVESEGAHANSILLLDEPGLHLHGTAQAKVIRFLEKLSKQNQTLYTTHSPFMVDVDHLERARAVYEREDGTTEVSEDVWPRDRDSLFPLQAALGYQLAQGLFLGKRQLIVEGLTDLWLLKAFDQALGARHRARLQPDLVIVPAAGVTKLLPLASMLVGHDVEVAALLDGDEPSRREGKKLVEKLLAGQDRKCLFIGDFVESKSGEIEDVFPEKDYLAAVAEAYPGIDLTFSAEEHALPGVVDRVAALFSRNQCRKFEKWRPAAILRDQIVAHPDRVDEKTIEVVERIFRALNSVFSA